MSGPCLSSSVADHPLRPATRLSLGGPLPRQLADRPRAPPQSPSQALAGRGCPPPPHPVLIQVSLGYSGLKGRLLTCYAPVCRSSIATVARLACLNHAASVHSEPGSNSPKILPKQVFEGSDPGIRTIFIISVPSEYAGDKCIRVFNFWSNPRSLSPGSPGVRFD